jgi:hypothetical protein
LRLFAIEIPVANIPPDDDLIGKRVGSVGSVCPLQLKFVQAKLSLLGIVLYLQLEVV